MKRKGQAEDLVVAEPAFGADISFMGIVWSAPKRTVPVKPKIRALWVGNGPKRIGKARDAWARVVVFGWNVPAPAAGHEACGER